MNQETQSNSQQKMQQQQQSQKLYDTRQHAEAVAAKTNFSFDMEMGRADDDFMRKPRSQAYMAIIASIDLLSSTDEEIIEKLREVVDEETLEEFSEMSVEELLEELRLSFQEEMDQKLEKLASLSEPQELVGVLSKCFIDGCYVHAINSEGWILDHYKKNGSIPDELAVGRVAYSHNENCNCVEVYSNCCRVIMPDGSVKKIMNYELQG